MAIHVSPATATKETHGSWIASNRARRGRALVVAIAAAAVTWLVLANIPALSLRVPTYSGSPPTSSALGLGQVLITTLVAGLLAWGVLAVIERRSRHARRLWTRVALLVGVASLLVPLSAPAITGSSRVALAIFHVVVGSVLIISLRATTFDHDQSPRSRQL